MSRPRRKSEFVKVPRTLLETIEQSWRIPPPSRGYTPMSDLGKELVSNGLCELRELLNPSGNGDELAKALDRADYWKQRSKSAEGHLWASDREKACEALTAFKERSGGSVSVVQAVSMVLGVIDERRRERLPADHQPMTWCTCGDGYPANSYGAGFMAANNNVCENCDAASKGAELDLDISDELAELRRDAARLDWIDENYTGHGGGTEFNLRLHLPCDIEEGGLRHAIDAAMERDSIE